MQAEFVRLASRQLPSRLVLREAVLRGVGGLADIEWRVGRWLPQARSGEFDDVDGVGARRRSASDLQSIRLREVIGMGDRLQWYVTRFPRQPAATAICSYECRPRQAS